MVASPGAPCQYWGVLVRMWRGGPSADSNLSTRGKAALVGRVWVIAAKVQIAVWREPLAEVVRALEGDEARARVSPARLSRAVSLGLRIGQLQPRCLVRSLVLYRLLRAQGDAAELVIGLPARPTTPGAHAWVELAGRDVGPNPGGTGYRELTRYPRHDARAD